MATRQRSMISGYFLSNVTRRRQIRRLRETQPSPRYTAEDIRLWRCRKSSKVEYGAAGRAAKS